MEVTICKPGGRVGLDDCESVSRKLEALLEEQQPPVLEGAYVLEVQSPGIDRILKSDRDFAVFQGTTVEVKYRENLAGLGYSFRGQLVGRSADTVTIANPQPLAPAKRQVAGSKSKPAAMAGIEEVCLDNDRVVHVRLYPENLNFDEQDATSLS
jgi:ribosome maturation factor RimP